MPTEHWERLKEVFEEALTKRWEDRDNYLLAACGNDLGLLAAARGLLASHDLSAEFPSSPGLTPAHQHPVFAPETIVAGRFRIVRFLNRGGTGEVYEAEDRVLGQRVALKTINRLLSADGEGLLKNEIQAARRVTHPNICRTYDIFEHAEPKMLLLTMELLEGPTLSQHLREHGPLTRAQALPLIEQVAAGLQAAHDAGVIHGDLKPGNVILAGAPGAWRAVVADFGLSPSPGSHWPRDSGTPGYMAPERFDGKPATTAADVYSLGVVIAGMLGSRATPDIGGKDTRKLGPWGGIVKGALALDAAERYQSPAAVVRALRRRNLRVWGGAIAVAAVSAVALLAFVPRSSSSGGLEQRMVCSGECDGDLSPNGRQLVFPRLGGLGIRDLASGDVRQIVVSPFGGVVCCAWFSPDGRHIAYNLYTHGPPNRSQVMIANADGSAQRALESNRFFAWSADGTRVLAGQVLDGRTVPGVSWFRISDGSRQSVSLESAIESFDQVSVSHDGKYVAVGRVAALVNSIVRADLVVKRADGSGETTVAAGPFLHRPVGWSPDDRYLLYSQHGDAAVLWAVPMLQGQIDGAPVRLKQFDRRTQFLGVTKAGTLHYRETSGSGDLYTASMDPTTGAVTSLPAALPLSTRGNGPATWSPDGKRLLYFASGDADSRELHVYTPATGEERRVPAKINPINSVCWDREDSILTSTRDGLQVFTERVDLSTGKSTRLFPRSSFRIWSCHGSTLSSFSPSAVFIRDLNTGLDTLLYKIRRPTADFGMSEISPDGRYLAFIESEDPETSVLRVVPAAGGPARELVRAKAPAQLSHINGFDWSPDGRFLYYFKRAGAQAPHELFRMPVEGGAEETMGLKGLEFRGLNISPDGRKIVFTIGAYQRPEIWALDNFLPSNAR